MPKLTCLLATLNHEKSLEEALESLRAQTFNDFEIIALDLGSSDDTPKILERYTKLEERLKVLPANSEKNFAVGYNMLMKQVKSPFFTFQGGEGISNPERFEKQIKRMTESSLVALGTSLTVDGTSLGQSVWEQKMPRLSKDTIRRQGIESDHMAIFHPTGIYSKSILKKKIEFDETMKAYSEILFHIELQAAFPLRLANIEENLYTHRLFSGCIEDLVIKGRIRIDPDQIENVLLGDFSNIYRRYIIDPQLSVAVQPF